jgi:hypothetical protein
MFKKIPIPRKYFGLEKRKILDVIAHVLFTEKHRYFHDLAGKSPSKKSAFKVAVNDLLTAEDEYHRQPELVYTAHQLPIKEIDVYSKYLNTSFQSMRSINMLGHRQRRIFHH